MEGTILRIDGQDVWAEEDISARSAHTKHFALPDGRRVAILSNSLHFRDRDTGRWEPCDHTVTAEARDGFSHAVNRAPLRARFGPDGKVRQGFGVGQFVTTAPVTPPGMPVQPLVDGNRVTYVDPWPFADLVYEHGGHRVKESIILRSPLAPASYAFRVTETGGVSLSPAADGGIDVLDTQGATLGRMLAPFCLDAAGVRGGAALTYDGTTLTVTPDAAWLADPARVFPVILDPSTVLQPAEATAKDARIDANSPTTNFGTSTDLETGKTGAGYVRRSLIEWDLSGIPGGNTIWSAVLELYGTVSGNPTINVHRVTSTWTESGVTWNSRNGTNNWTTAGGDYDGTVQASNNTTGTGSKSYDITALVTGWYNSTWPNYGHILKASSEVTGEFHSYESSNASNRPKLTIIYSNPSAAITSPNGTQASPTTINDDVTPTLSFVYNNTTSDNMQKYQAQIHDDAGNLVYDFGEVTQSATPGSTVNVVTPPAAGLKYGVKYRWRVKVWDVSGGYSTWTANGTGDGCWFLCTLTAPTALTATADAPNAEIDLAWTAHGGENLAGYNVYSSPDAGATWEKINTALVTGTTYSDRYIKSGINMIYKLTAVATDGYESAYSTTASATVTITATWLNASQVKLRGPARRGLTRERMASARLALDGTYVHQDRGWGSKQMQLEALYKSLAELDALYALIATDTVLYYRDAIGDRFRGKPSVSAQIEELFAGAGWLVITLAEVTPS